MALFKRGIPRPGLTDTVTIRNDRDRRDLRAHLRDGLADLAARADAGTPAHELQLVVQVCGAASYPKWRAGRQKTWNGTPYTTQTWPTGLPTDGSAVLLLPIPAGRVGPAAGAHPRNTMSPLFVVVTSSGTPEDAALALVCSWVCNPGPDITARLAPPVIEHVGYVRSVQSWDLSWPLPVADGV